MSKPRPDLFQLVEGVEFEASVVIRAAEDFTASYRKNRKTFKALVRNEERLYRSMDLYFAGLADRVDRYIKWYKYKPEIQASDDDFIDDDDWDEQASLTASLYSSIADALGIGVDAAEILYTIPRGELASSVYMQRAASERVANLVKDISSVTRDRIRASIETSLNLRENLQEARDRVYGVVDDRSRADRIARTESVNAYQAGVLDYGRSTGAISKTWESSPDACDDCQELDGEQVGIDDTYSSGDDAPPAHPNCRCGQVLDYPDGTEDEDASDE